MKNLEWYFKKLLKIWTSKLTPEEKRYDQEELEHNAIKDLSDEDYQKFEKELMIKRQLYTKRTKKFQ